MTNFESMKLAIEDMTIEEFAERFVLSFHCDNCKYAVTEFCDEANCKDEFIKWLEKEQD